MSQTEPAANQIEQLVVQYLPYAEALAWSLRNQLPSTVEMEEVLSLARLGLTDAAQKFDPSRRVSFKTYAYYRIRGAIYDGVRALGISSRREICKYKFTKGMDLFLQNEQDARAGDVPPPRAPAASELKQLVGVMTSIYLLSLDSILENSDILADTLVTPDKEMEKTEAVERLKQVIQHLSSQEQSIIHLYYYENRTLDEIGQALNLSKSWVCRMHGRVLKKLHALFTRTDKIGKGSLRA